MKTLSIAALIAISAATPVSALTIDSDTYFAYTSAEGQTIAISQQPCGNPGFAKFRWKKAVHYGISRSGIPSCWKPESETVIQLCWISPTNSQALEGCFSADKNRFMKTSSLPVQAKF